MWIRRADNSVINLETDHVFAVRYQDDSKLVRTYELVSNYPGPGRTAVVLQSGYVEYADAVKALDDLLGDLDINAVQIVDPTEDETETHKTAKSKK